MIFSKFARFAVTAAFLVAVSAHTKRSPEEMIKYHRQVTRDAQALSNCLETPELKELGARVQAKRQESFHHLKARSLEPRTKEDIQKWDKIIHDKTAEGKAKDFKNDETLFGYKKGDDVPPPSCILAPENVWGPYWQERAAYRQDIRENQQGVYQRLALHVIDVTTCKPLQGARVDIWQANAEGRYAKQDRNEGKGDVYWLTGAYATSDWGTVDFDAIFPGHYTGRNVHTHLAVRPSGDSFNNPDGFIHKGQIFYDEYPREEIDQYAPYKNNKQKVVKNVDDSFAQYGSSAVYDPIAQWAWLDDQNHQAGLVTWITFGVNTSVHQKDHD